MDALLSIGWFCVTSGIVGFAGGSFLRKSAKACVLAIVATEAALGVSLRLGDDVELWRTGSLPDMVVTEAAEAALAVDP